MSMLQLEGKLKFTSPALSIISKVEIKCPSKPEKIILNNKSVEYDFIEKLNLVKFQCEQNTDINIEMIY
jgi:hypothetical protein